MLYIVSTPIGNLNDITFRAIEILKKVDLILCEDTRETLKLLNHYDIKNHLLSYYKDNEYKRIGKVIEMLKEGKEIALVCDRGTPGISDASFLLVREAYKNNIKVIPIPGPSSLTSAISVSALPSSQFTFYGFLPKGENKKRKLMESLIEREETLIFFESVHRINETLKIIKDVFQNREMTVCRELTKKFEEIKYGSVEEVVGYFLSKKNKGEFVILIKGDKNANKIF